VSELMERSNESAESRPPFSSSLRSFRYMLRLGEVHKTWRGKRRAQQSTTAEGKKLSSVPSGDDEGDDEEEDEDDDTGIQIRPLQENKVTSSSYVSPSSSSPGAGAGAGPFEFDYYSASVGEGPGDGDADGKDLSPHTAASSSSPPLDSPPASTSEAGASLVAAAEDYWILPNHLRLCLFFFYFVVVGLETGYGGWISTYAIKKAIAKTDSGGAYLASVFFFAVSAGRLAAIPLASLYTPNFLLRIQLTIVIVGVVLVATIGMGQVGYTGLSIATAVLGYGLSCIFPLGLSVTQDFNQLLM
jgi:hypothetical protein